MTTTSLSIHEYATPIVSVRPGNGNIISGNFKIIHQIDLHNYANILNDIKLELKGIDSTSGLKSQLTYQIYETEKLLRELQGQPPRAKRSINWIGSAWKWIAGSPDATDWDQILKSQDRIIENNNEQYKINTAITNKIQKLLNQHNEILLHLEDNTNGTFQQLMFNRLQIVKEEVKEIVRAAQLAKGGIINSNLLDKDEIARLVTEIETLPYSNEIEAIEYAEPTMIIKNTTILYIIAIPKTSREEFHHIKIRSTINNSKQIHLEYSEILINQHNIYGIIDKCQTRRETIICDLSQLQELKESHCINQLLKGLNAGCEFTFNEKESIEPITENTIFLNNFQGTVTCNNSTRHLKGNYLVQYQNESIEIKGWIFTNKETKTSQILPPVLQTNITERGMKLNLEYLHGLHVNNIGKLQKLFTYQKINNVTDSIVIITIVAVIVVLIIRLRNRKGITIFKTNEETNQQAVPLGMQPVQLKF